MIYVLISLLHCVLGTVKCLFSFNVTKMVMYMCNKFTVILFIGQFAQFVELF